VTAITYPTQADVFMSTVSPVTVYPAILNDLKKLLLPSEGATQLGYAQAGRFVTQLLRQDESGTLQCQIKDNV